METGTTWVRGTGRPAVASVAMDPGPLDQDCVTRALAGDTDAYAEFFGRHAPRLGRMAYLLLHDSHLAEDAVQETFARGLAGLSRYRGESKPDVWLISIALHVIRQHLREETKRERCLDPGALESGRPPGRVGRGVLTSVMRRETEQRMALSLGYLTEAQREVFVLHYIQGLAYEGIAELLGTSSVAARSLAHRAKAVLRSKIPHNNFPAIAT